MGTGKPITAAVTVRTTTKKEVKISVDDLDRFLKKAFGYDELSDLDCQFDWQVSQGFVSSLVIRTTETKDAEASEITLGKEAK